MFSHNDVICALAGDDTVTAGAGNDIVDGGPGRDTAIVDGHDHVATDCETIIKRP